MTLSSRSDKKAASSAWLITWEWMGDHAAAEEPLIAVLSGRLRYKRVADFVQWTWASAKLTPEEWLDGIRNRKLAYEPHPGVLGTVQWQGEMTCGHTPSFGHGSCGTRGSR